MAIGLSELPGDGIEYKGRRFTVSDLRLISDLAEEFGRLSRQELANTVCELLEWRRPNGGLKTWESKAFLAELQDRGLTVDEIWDIGAITAFFAMSNRLANLTSMRPNDEFFSMAR